MSHDSQQPRRIRPARSQDSISSSQHCARRPPRRHPLQSGLFPFEAGSRGRPGQPRRRARRIRALLLPPPLPLYLSLSISQAPLFPHPFRRRRTLPPIRSLHASRCGCTEPATVQYLLIASHASTRERESLVALLSAGPRHVKGPAVWPLSPPFPLIKPWAPWASVAHQHLHWTLGLGAPPWKPNPHCLRGSPRRRGPKKERPLRSKQYENARRLQAAPWLAYYLLRVPWAASSGRAIISGISHAQRGGIQASYPGRKGCCLESPARRRASLLAPRT